MDLRTPAFHRALENWIDEDLGRGDLTRCALSDLEGSAYWIAKQPGILCGGKIAKLIFQRLDPKLQINLLIEDGEHFHANQTLLKLKGSTDALTSGERTALNICMHLSGITTKTAQLVSELKGTDVLLADTRKTTPGLRLLEKYAFRCGGGINHRLGLDDAAMLKENHIAWAGNIENAIQKIRSNAPWPSKVIVEAETPEQAEEAVLAGADGVLLDEIDPTVLCNLVPRLRKLAIQRQKHQSSSGHIILEASGVKAEQLKAYAASGVDLISSSAPITKSTWLDFSMRYEEAV